MSNSPQKREVPSGAGHPGWLLSASPLFNFVYFAPIHPAVGFFSKGVLNSLENVGKVGENLPWRSGAEVKNKNIPKFPSNLGEKRGKI